MRLLNMLAALLLVAATAHAADQKREFSTFLGTLPEADVPLGSLDRVPVKQGGTSKIIPGPKIVTTTGSQEIKDKLIDCDQNDCRNFPSLSRFPTNEALRAASRNAYPGVVWRDDIADGQGAPPLPFRSLLGTCAVNGFVNDLGDCVDGTDGNSRKAIHLAPGLDVRQFGVVMGSSADQSTLTQNAINAVKRPDGKPGGVLRIPAGNIYAKHLSLPDYVCIIGAGRGFNTPTFPPATQIILPDGANTWLLASANTASGSQTANTGGCLRELTLDGNNTNNTSGDLFTLFSFKFNIEDVDFNNAAGAGLLITDRNFDGTFKTGNAAAMHIGHSAFNKNKGGGIYANNDANRVADVWITDSDFNGNGGNGVCNIRIERAAGFHILNNQTYSGPSCEMEAQNAHGFEAVSNNFDCTASQAASGITQCVRITLGGWADATIVGNQIYTHATSYGTASGMTLLALENSNPGSLVVSGNSFYSVFNLPVKSITYLGQGATAQTPLIATSNSFHPYAPPPAASDAISTLPIGVGQAVPMPQGRITLSSTNAVQRLDQIDVSTVYYLPHVGNAVPINGMNGIQYYAIPDNTVALSIADATNFPANTLFDFYAFLTYTATTAVAGLPGGVPTGITGYVSGDVVTTSDGSTWNVDTTKLMSATVANGGSGCTGTMAVLTGTTGVGTEKFTVTAPIVGGSVGGQPITVGPIAGRYTTNPTNLAAEPVTGSGCIGVTLNLNMGIYGLSANTPAPNLMAIPTITPLTQTATTGVGTGHNYTTSYRPVVTYGAVPWQTSTVGSSARGTTAAIVKSNGIWTNNATPTAYNGSVSYVLPAKYATLIGTLATNGTAGKITAAFSPAAAAGGSVGAMIGYGNIFNQVPVSTRSLDNSSTNYATTNTTLTPLNDAIAGGLNNRVSWVDPLGEIFADLSFSVTGRSSLGGALAWAAIGVNSTTAATGKMGTSTSANATDLVSSAEIPPPQATGGLNYGQALTRATSGQTATFLTNSSSTQLERLSYKGRF